MKGNYPTQLEMIERGYSKCECDYHYKQCMKGYAQHLGHEIKIRKRRGGRHYVDIVEQPLLFGGAMK